MRVQTTGASTSSHSATSAPPRSPPNDGRPADTRARSAARA
ncbi:MAG: hypothetical protein ABW000_06005 [Actinoplanes sp.]